MEGKMALGRKRLHNFSVSLNSWREITEDHPKETAKKISLIYSSGKKKGVQTFTALKVWGKWVRAQIKQHYMVSQSAAYAMILS